MMSAIDLAECRLVLDQNGMADVPIDPEQGVDRLQFTVGVSDGGPFAMFAQDEIYGAPDHWLNLVYYKPGGGYQGYDTAAEAVEHFTEIYADGGTSTAVPRKRKRNRQKPGTGQRRANP